MTIDDHDILLSKKGAGLILELSDDGIAHIWPMIPAFRAGRPLAQEAETNQDFSNYLFDGDWAAELPWMYFHDLDEVMTLMNRNEISVSYKELGSFPSIRAARATLYTPQI